MYADFIPQFLLAVEKSIQTWVEALEVMCPAEVAMLKTIRDEERAPVAKTHCLDPTVAVFYLFYRPGERF